jgi:ammonium transporter Rh
LILLGFQAGYQIAGLGLTLVFAVVGGIITGFIMRLSFIDQVKNNEEMFEDHLFWETPSDYALTVTEITENDLI